MCVCVRYCSANLEGVKHTHKEIYTCGSVWVCLYPCVSVCVFVCECLLCHHKRHKPCFYCMWVSEWDREKDRETESDAARLCGCEWLHVATLLQQKKCKLAPCPTYPLPSLPEHPLQHPAGLVAQLSNGGASNQKRQANQANFSFGDKFRIIKKTLSKRRRERQRQRRRGQQTERGSVGETEAQQGSPAAHVLHLATERG